ncbi:HNH endonuclease family protein [Allocoleopsis sp.]|uniref:HNH endonuclease family protein n=1 Tax=Allocoleopsis sp. TaxID=3088169 RepID=UPI002FCED333
MQRGFKRLKLLELKNCHPLLLNLCRDYEKKQLSLKEFEQALLHVESYYVRRILGDLTSVQMNKVFNGLYQDAKKLREEYSLSDFASALREKLRRLPTTSKSYFWPDDDEFRRSIIENTVKIDRSRVKLLLGSLAEPLTKFQVKTDDLTLEHIMPQKLTDEWRTRLGANADEVHKRWLNTLGNLTLTPSSYNSEMSNNSFSDKLSYLRTSALTLDNQYFKNVETWNVDEIQRRGKYLADIAVKVWPR